MKLEKISLLFIPKTRVSRFLLQCYHEVSYKSEENSDDSSSSLRLASEDMSL